ncbi:hypothetical protein PFLUV_G00199900 [Perca fluviatilis]|uniref:Uncharacterized protein n=3 Tax=Perca fluviatilis TaxID=8168 RepID=A0A6A5DTJ4_PERFL|nr:hypothetical protein PFLUV_G00199900 [Perca fluviatilis]
MFREEVSDRFWQNGPQTSNPGSWQTARILMSMLKTSCLGINPQMSLAGTVTCQASYCWFIYFPHNAKGPKKSPKISSHHAVKHVGRYSRIGASVETFLESLEPRQPILLCVGEQKNNLQRFYIIVDHKAIPGKAQTSLAAFDELFKAHFIFSVNYQESLHSFYTFIQTTVFNIGVGSTEESPRVKELRARLLNTSI